MSEFDDNPFADPFVESSIQQATQPTSNAVNSLAEYDPFASTNQSSVKTQPPQPAVMTPTNITNTAAPPAYTQSAQQQVTSEEFQRRQDELERKAAELARREEELKAASGGARQHNWPPIPSNCPVGPCFYQDINVDIPLEFQKIVRMLYYLWMFHIVMLMVNVLGGLALFISIGEGSTFFLSLLFLALFSPLSYMCWFRPIYKAFRSDSSFNFMVFFFVFFFQMLISILQAVGIPSIGACGILGGLRYINGSSTAEVLDGVFILIIGLIWAGVAMADMIILTQVHRIYRSSGASMAKAQQEFAQGVMKNEHVQHVATNAASAAVRNQFATQSPGSGSTASSGPRF